MDRQTVNQDRLQDVLNAAQAAAQRGDRQRAYQYSLQATRIAPSDVRAWLARAENAPSEEEHLFCLSQVSTLDANHPAVQSSMYAALRSLLDRDPYLAYIDETDDFYRVRNNLALSLSVPKYRWNYDSEEQPKSPKIRAAFRWLIWALLGLATAGIGTLFLAPFAALSAIQAMRTPLYRADRVRSLVIVWAAALLWIAALPLAFVFILHFIG